MRNVWGEFKEFAMRGNVIDMAIGILIGSAFSPIARSLVDDVIMPPVGLLLGKVDFENLFWVIKAGDPAPPYATPAAAEAAGAVTVDYGLFINNLFTFFIVAWVAFLIVKAINNLKRQEEGAEKSEPTTKKCPYCLSSIPVRATRCPQCTSQLAEGQTA